MRRGESAAMVTVSFICRRASASASPPSLLVCPSLTLTSNVLHSEDFTACPSALASRVSFVCSPALAVQESRVSTDTSSCWRVNKDSAEGTSVPQVALDRCFERTCTEPRALSAPLKETMSLPLSDWLNDQNESTRVQNGVLITPRIPTSFSSTI